MQHQLMILIMIQRMREKNLEPSSTDHGVMIWSELMIPKVASGCFFTSAKKPNLNLS